MKTLQILALLIACSPLLAKGNEDLLKGYIELPNTEIVDILSNPSEIKYLREHCDTELDPRVLLVNILEERNVIRSKFKEDIVNRELRIGMNKEEIQCILGQPYDWQEEWITPSSAKNSSHFSFKEEIQYFQLPDKTRIKVRFREGISMRFDRF
jgi:hypothetical protein